MALAGALALLVGVSARRRVQRLKRDGLKAWAEAIHRPLPDGEEHEGRPPVTLQYTLTDGRVLERSARAGGARRWHPAKKCSSGTTRTTRRKSSFTGARAALRTWRSSSSA